jgi:competence protein ComEC
MTLLYLALAYLVGIFLGRGLWEAGWIGCTFPNWLWWIPLAGLPFAPLLTRLRQQPDQSIRLRWPVSAGFVAPRPTFSAALLGGILLSLLTGVLRYASHPLAPCLQPTDLGYYNLAADAGFAKKAPETAVVGYVSTYPTVKDTKQSMQVQATQLIGAGTEQPVNGLLALSTGIRQRYQYGQVVRLRGRLATPPDFPDFSYREYLSRKNVHSLLYRAQIEPVAAPNQGNPLLRLLYAIRARGEAFLNRALSEPYAALANGMLLGIQAGIPDALYDKFNLTGSSHVIVISGSNVSIISVVLMGFSQRLLGRRRALWPTLFGIACFALLVGGDPAVLRAAVMGSLCVIATVLDRRSTAIVSLAVACWVMTLLNPLTVWDVGFELSSGATLGLILFSPLLLNWFKQWWPECTIQTGGNDNQLSLRWLSGTTCKFLRGLVEDGLLTTWAANTTTLPLTAYYFGRFSLVGLLLTNLCILPVQPLITLGGSAGVLLGIVGLTSIGQLVLWIAWLGLVWTVAIVGQTALLPYANVAIEGYGIKSLLVTYVVLFALRWRKPLTGWLQRLWRLDLMVWLARLVGPVVVGGFGIAVIVIWARLLAQPDGRLHLYFLDIGQGDGIFIQTPSGRQLLIDGGGSPQQLFNQLGVVMPFWDHAIDMMVMTNPDKDHMGAQVETPARFTLTRAWQTKASAANHDADQWRANLAATGVTLEEEHQGAWVDLGDGVALWVLWPPPEPFGMNGGNTEQYIDNENSLVMKLVYGDFSVLLTGDAGIPAETQLLRAKAPLASTVLKVGHHGSKGSTGNAFVQTVNPAVAVIQVGADNDYGHPHRETLERLAGRLVLRNDLHGRIHIYSDGQQMWIETEKEKGLAKN